MDIRYPIGRFESNGKLSGDERLEFIRQIEAASARLRAAVDGLSDEQLDTPYRRGGWTVRQVVHHLADSHLNLYVRFRLALTEDDPTVGLFDEAAWAELPDARTGPVDASLQLLDALHRRWSALLRRLTDEEYRRGFGHPEYGTVTLEECSARVAWHGRHHVAQITALRQRRGWTD